MNTQKSILNRLHGAIDAKWTAYARITPVPNQVMPRQLLTVIFSSRGLADYVDLMSIPFTHTNGRSTVYAGTTYTVDVTQVTPFRVVER